MHPVVARFNQVQLSSTESVMGFNQPVDRPQLSGGGTVFVPDTHYIYIQYVYMRHRSIRPFSQTTVFVAI